MYLNQYKYLGLTSNIVKNIDKLMKKKETLALKIIEESENATVEQLIKSILSKEEN